jgi:leucyl aminopeptidase
MQQARLRPYFLKGTPMTPLPKFTISELDLDRLQGHEGQIVLLVQEDGRMDAVGRRINKATKGALARFLESKGFEDLESGKVMTLSYPTGLMARAVSVAKINRNSTQGEVRSCGVEITKASVSERFVIAFGKFKRISDLIEGMALRNYEYLDQKSDAAPKPFDVEVMGPDALEQQAEIETKLAVLEGVFFTRDLTNAPANILTTSHFAEQLTALSDLGLEVEVLEEAELEKLGMRTLALRRPGL